MIVTDNFDYLLKSVFAFFPRIILQNYHKMIIKNRMKNIVNCDKLIIFAAQRQYCMPTV